MKKSAGLAAIILILVGGSVAWMVLSAAMSVRTRESQGAMSDAVGGLWGTAHSQEAPTVRIDWKTTERVKLTDEEQLDLLQKKKDEEKRLAARLKRPEKPVYLADAELFRDEVRSWTQPVELDSSSVDVGLRLDYRQKGLLWFSTYKVDFRSSYTIRNPKDFQVRVSISFPFPSARGVYDNMSVTAPDQPDLEFHAESDPQRLTATFTLPAGGKQTVTYAYQSRGVDEWTYRFGQNTRMVKNFRLVMRTDFCDIDFPRDSISPDHKNRRPDNGWTLEWKKESLVSAFQIGMVMPKRLNPGPLAASISSHAPVSLLFFFFVVFTLQFLRGIRLHPMHYFFLACSFFAFNLLFSYLVDHLNLRFAFVISAAVSYLLVVTYLKRVVGMRFALLEAGLSQVIYHFLFALAHFFEGYTGLAITIGAILTLGFVMHLTAKVNWADAFSSPPTKKPPRPTPPGPSPFQLDPPPAPPINGLSHEGN